MGRRGRRPHPDILTPREWEVLDLLRERLTNEQIAERLGITLDGAKYHVSEILSKLGASSREEAARWPPAELRPWWMRLIALPAAAKIAGVLTLIAAAALGLGLVGYLLLSSDGEDVSTADGRTVDDAPQSVAEPGASPVTYSLTKDQALALVFAGGKREDRVLFSLETFRTTFGEANQLAARFGVNFSFPIGAEPEPDAPAWLIILHGRNLGPQPIAATRPLVLANQPMPSPSDPSCENLAALIHDSLQHDWAGSGSNRVPCQEQQPIDRESAILLGAVGSAILKNLVASRITAEEMNLDEAVAVDPFPGEKTETMMSGETSVWLVRYQELYPSPALELVGVQTPTLSGPLCTAFYVIIDAETGREISGLSEPVACDHPRGG